MHVLDWYYLQARAVAMHAPVYSCVFLSCIARIFLTVSKLASLTGVVGSTWRGCRLRRWLTAGICVHATYAESQLKSLLFGCTSVV